MTSPQTNKLAFAFGGDNSLSILAAIPNPAGQNIGIVQAYFYARAVDVSEVELRFYFSTDGSISGSSESGSFGTSYGNPEMIDITANGKNYWPADHYLVIRKYSGDVTNVDATLYLELLYLDR